jgi:sortase A
VDANALVVSGEEYETFETFLTVTENAELYSDITPTTVPLELPDDVVLTALGRISIEKIDLNIPLLDDAGVVPLRYGAGMLEKTALPGEEGNFVVLRHRMKAYGSLFNRLDEVAVGDSVVITTLDNEEFTYIVDNVIPKLDPEELIDYIKIDSGSGKQLTLVTCTPTGVGSHRIIVIAHME